MVYTVVSVSVLVPLPGPPYVIHFPYWLTIRTDSVIRTLRVRISELTSVSEMGICTDYWLTIRTLRVQISD